MLRENLSYFEPDNTMKIAQTAVYCHNLSLQWSIRCSRNLNFVHAKPHCYVLLIVIFFLQVNSETCLLFIIQSLTFTPPELSCNYPLLALLSRYGNRSQKKKTEKIKRKDKQI